MTPSAEHPADPRDLRPIVERVLDEQASTVADYLGGRDKAFGFLVGQVMAATRGKASPQVANALLRQVLAYIGITLRSAPRRRAEGDADVCDPSRTRVRPVR